MGGQPQNLTDTIAMINYQRAIPRAPNISGLLSPNHWQSSPRLPFQMGEHEFGRRDPILWQPQNRENNWKRGNHGENKPPIDLALGWSCAWKMRCATVISPMAEIIGTLWGKWWQLCAYHCSTFVLHMGVSEKQGYFIPSTGEASSPMANSYQVKRTQVWQIVNLYASQSNPPGCPMTLWNSSRYWLKLLGLVGIS
jgi:hypothetical protein